MLGLEPNLQSRKVGCPKPIDSGAGLVGYLLTARGLQVNHDSVLSMEGRSARAGFQISRTENDCGLASNPFRNGLWNVLRLLVCTACEPKRMPLTMMNFDDFLNQALQPCKCGANKGGASGMVVCRLEHISSDRSRCCTLIMALAKKGKHVIADDGICLSCCHPATQKLLGEGSC